MDYISAGEAANKFGLTLRTIQNYCASGKIAGVKKFERSWMIPANSVRPLDNRKKGSVPTGPLLYQGLMLFERIRFDGRSIEELAAELPNDEYKTEFYSELAFYQGKIEKSIDIVDSIHENGLFRMTVLYGRCITAILNGDYNMLCRTRNKLKDLREKSCACSGDEMKFEIAEATLDVGIYAVGLCPEWLVNGDFSNVTADLKPYALYLYTRYLHAAGEFTRMLAVAETTLSLIGGDGFTTNELFLYNMCAIAHVELGNNTKAREYLVRALELALPYGLIYPFSENLITMRGEMEKIVKEHYPEYYKPLVALGKRVFSGWLEIHNSLLKNKATALLTVKEYQTALYLTKRLTYKEIASRMGTTQANVNYTLQIIREKLGVKNSRAIKEFIVWNKEYGSAES